MCEELGFSVAEVVTASMENPGSSIARNMTDQASLRAIRSSSVRRGLATDTPSGTDMIKIANA